MCVKINSEISDFIGSGGSTLDLRLLYYGMYNCENVTIRKYLSHNS
jgi:hypothetical protein